MSVAKGGKILGPEVVLCREGHIFIVFQRLSKLGLHSNIFS